ncbi:hypothetical protein V1520DRAFT_107580 [Lipomyces starkeyi]|uniref:Uncharacterized protein n=1 Tax=Lipomyces starkeyi NRRL Y-11557 TaxID=675824 RepID=A0A1E3Q0P9_LIPST|nr:hypothetical protein LIPSTDRAFT_106431 [Lipomyces starkeyi NRRL Y-11557]
MFPPPYVLLFVCHSILLILVFSLLSFHPANCSYVLTLLALANRACLSFPCQEFSCILSSSFLFGVRFALNYPELGIACR